MNLQKLYHIILASFLVLVFSFPRVLQGFKVMLLALLIVFVVLLKKDIIAVLKFFFLYLLLFVIPVITASMYGNESAYIFDGIKIYYFFPLVLTMIFYATDIHVFKRIIYIAAVISLVIITLMSITTLLNGFGSFPVNLNALFYKDEDRIGLNEGYIHIINSPLSYYIFLIPVVFYNGDSFKLSNVKLYLFILLLIFSVLTGRRILVLPFVLIILYHFKRFYKYSAIIVIALLLFLSSNKFENFDPSMIVTRFEDAINSSGDSDSRQEQSQYFIKYIDDRPLFGYGIGSYMKDYLRNDEFKTAYERSYEYLVFCVGIPLALIILCFYLYMLFRTWKSYSNDDYLKKGIVLGVISLMLASFTNPYWLSSFDYVIPFAILITLFMNTSYGKQNFGYYSNI